MALLKTLKRIFNQTLLRCLDSEKCIRDIQYAERFRSAILDSPWLLRQNFLLSGWAIDYCGLFHCFRILEKLQPAKIVEFGIGESTKMFSQYVDYHAGTQLLTFEHDPIWIDVFRQSPANHDKNCNIVECPLETVSFRGTSTLRYAGDMGEYTGDQIELIFLDGPRGFDLSYARTQILDLIPDHLNRDKFCIIIHDYHRKGEKNTAKMVMEKLDAAKIACKTNDYHGMNGMLMIVPERYGFLT